LDEPVVRAATQEFASLIGEIDVLRQELDAIDADLELHSSGHRSGAILAVGRQHISASMRSALDQLRDALVDHVDSIDRSCAVLRSVDRSPLFAAPGD
jgi:hypothetical protein